MNQLTNLESKSAALHRTTALFGKILLMKVEHIFLSTGTVCVAVTVITGHAVTPICIICICIMIIQFNFSHLGQAMENCCYWNKLQKFSGFCP